MSSPFEKLSWLCPCDYIAPSLEVQYKEPSATFCGWTPNQASTNTGYLKTYRKGVEKRNTTRASSTQSGTGENTYTSSQTDETVGWEVSATYNLACELTENTTGSYTYFRGMWGLYTTGTDANGDPINEIVQTLQTDESHIYNNTFGSFTKRVQRWNSLGELIEDTTTNGFKSPSPVYGFNFGESAFTTTDGTTVTWLESINLFGGDMTGTHTRKLSEPWTLAEIKAKLDTAAEALDWQSSEISDIQARNYLNDAPVTTDYRLARYRIKCPRSAALLPFNLEITWAILDADDVEQSTSIETITWTPEEHQSGETTNTDFFTSWTDLIAATGETHIIKALRLQHPTGRWQQIHPEPD